MNPYCFVCSGCDHPLNIHTLVEPNGELVAGPYRCADCGCEVGQDAPWYPWNREQADEYHRKAPKRVYA